MKLASGIVEIAMSTIKLIVPLLPGTTKLFLIFVDSSLTLVLRGPKVILSLRYRLV